MKAEFVKIIGKLTADTFGCDEAYFKKYIKGKNLKIVHETPNHYVRVTDQNQEEWGLFNHQYTIVTGVEIPVHDEGPEAAKKILLRKEIG